MQPRIVLHIRLLESDHDFLLGPLTFSEGGDTGLASGGKSSFNGINSPLIFR